MDDYSYLVPADLLSELIVYPQELQIFLYLLSKAAKKETSVIYRGACVSASQGEVITSRQTISRDLNIIDSQVKSSLKRLQEMGLIRITASKRFSTIFIIGYFVNFNNEPCSVGVYASR